MNAVERIKEIFSQALETEAGPERDDFLAEACGGDSELRRQVESLLLAHEQAGAFLGKTVLLPAQDFGMERTGTMIGRYKLLQRIGEGGFGVVYRAEQVEPVQRKVALKIIKAGMDTREVVARFEAERQALALMDHPNIARVFDAGATEAGRPYFVMELVNGIPLTDYCDREQLSTTERLHLFMRVCHAVQHAHQKGVIHRDLKPSNILVTVKDDQPVPKVIDFGVAKATQARLTEKTLFTRCNQWIGTPAYMSPEQAGLGSLDVDTRSDVYSLGVLLYELLTGRPPFDTQKLLAAGYDAVMRTIREDEPPKPSTRLCTLKAEELSQIASHRHIDPTKLERAVRGDLDWIVMKALEKDRSRRYESANGLAADLQRHLGDEPVVARPPSTAYRLQKAWRRNKVAFAAAAAILAALALGIAISTWEAVRASEAETLANARLVAALGLVDSLIGGTNLTQLSSLIGATEATERMIQSLMGTVQGLNRENIANPQVRLRLANLNTILGTVRGVVPGSSSLGDPQTAMQFSAEAMRLLDDPSVRELPRVTWLPALLSARMGMGFNEHALGRFDEALNHFQTALNEATELATDSSFNQPVVAQLYRSRCQVSIGRILRDKGRDQDALEEYFLPAYKWSLSQKLTNDEHLTVCLNIGDTYTWLGQAEKALPFSEEALRMSEFLALSSPNNARAMGLLAAAKSQKGKVLLALGEAERAKPLLADSLNDAQRLVTRDPANAGMRLIFCYVLAGHALGYAAWSREETAPLSERRERYERACFYFVQAGEQIDRMPFKSAQILPRYILESSGKQIEAAGAQIESRSR